MNFDIFVLINTCFIIVALSSAVTLRLRHSALIFSLLTLISITIFYRFVTIEVFSYLNIVKYLIFPFTIFFIGYVVSIATERRKLNIWNLNELNKKLDSDYHLLLKKFKEVDNIRVTLEKKIVRDDDFSIKLHDAISNLSALNYKEIKYEILNIIRDFVNARKVAFYDFTNKNFILHSVIPDDQDITNIFNESHELYHTIISSDGVLTIKDKLADNKSGIILLSLLKDKKGDILGAILVFDIDFTDINSANISLFNIICRWASIELVKARRLALYEFEYTKFEDTDIPNFIYFSKIVNVEFYKVKRYDYFFTAIVIKIQDIDQIIKDEFLHSINTISKMIKERLRDSDLIFFNDVKGDSFILLLTETDIKGANIVKNIIHKNIDEKQIFPYYNKSIPIKIESRIYFFDKETEKEKFDDFMVTMLL